MDERDWTTRTPDPGATLMGEGVTIRCAAESGASLVSGDLDAAIASLAPGAPMLGLLDEVPEKPFALRIARDRALLCTDAPLGQEGWRDGFAVSGADDLFLVIEITGARRDEIRSACLGGGVGSPSAATLFAGQGALVATCPGGLCVRVEAPQAAALWTHLDRLIAAL